MKTPICDFVNNYLRSDNIRAHMPGHKGVGSIEKYDITEISGADSLFEAAGIIEESEKNASELFGAHTFYSTEGSSLSIKAALYLAALFARENGKEPIILAARNVHKSFVHGAALLDLKVEWLYGQGDSYLQCRITEKNLINYLKNAKKIPTALYLTSPDYLGNLQDIRALSRICREYGMLLICDNAHGAYLKFISDKAHPIDLGADIVCDSAHKTLPVLTGGAYLHISKDAPATLRENAKAAMALFGSTSPSYLILESLDKFNATIPDFSHFVCRMQELKNKLFSLGYKDLSEEKIKITIAAKEYGYFGFEIGEILEKNRIYPEFYDRDFLVLMLSPTNSDRDFDMIYHVLSSITKKERIANLPPKLTKPKTNTDMRCALLSPSEVLPTNECLGKTLAEVTVGCPPAVPILVCGEIIDESAIAAFTYYGVKKLSVLK